LFVNTLRDTISVIERTEELKLNPHIVHNPIDVADKELR
jgi:hypothetical protein